MHTDRNGFVKKNGLTWARLLFSPRLAGSIRCWDVQSTRLQGDDGSISALLWVSACSLQQFRVIRGPEGIWSSRAASSVLRPLSSSSNQSSFRTLQPCGKAPAAAEGAELSRRSRLHVKVTRKSPAVVPLCSKSIQFWEQCLPGSGCRTFNFDLKFQQLFLKSERFRPSKINRIL